MISNGQNIYDDNEKETLRIWKRIWHGNGIS